MFKSKLKKAVAQEALKYIKNFSIIGIGSGSTVSYFIDILSTIKKKIVGVVSSSFFSSKKIRELGIPLLNLNSINNTLDIYIDSADEINDDMQMIKGKGAALTKEKIIASASKIFVCIIDYSKKVSILGKSPLPVEVIPVALSFVKKKLSYFGGYVKYRDGVVTDNGNFILDIYNLKIFDALYLEREINNIPGVIDVGLFAKRKADILLVSYVDGVKFISI